MEDFFFTCMMIIFFAGCLAASVYSMLSLGWHAGIEVAKMWAMRIRIICLIILLLTAALMIGSSILFRRESVNPTELLLFGGGFLVGSSLVLEIYLQTMLIIVRLGSRMK